MVQGIGSGGGGMAREAILAAMRSQREAATAGVDLAKARVYGAEAGLGPAAGAQGAQGPDFARALSDGLAEVGQAVDAAERLPQALVSGEVGDFSEVAVLLKQSDLSFRFALQVRNKLIDAYREVMRMSV